MKTRTTLFAVACAGLLAIGYAIYPGRPDVSDDIGKLQSIVQIPIPARAIRWEIYKVPDDEGIFALGPVDYVQLVAEVEPGDKVWFARQPDDGSVLSIGPNAERSWLSPPFRTLLKDQEKALRSRANCKRHKSTITSSGRPVKGVVCEHQGLLLLYLMLSE